MNINARLDDLRAQYDATRERRNKYTTSKKQNKYILQQEKLHFTGSDAERLNITLAESWISDMEMKIAEAQSGMDRIAAEAV
jgi:hypothetical protein